MVRIPLRDRSGGIVAHAVIDAADEEWVGRFAWCLNANGYAWRSIMGGRRHVYLHRSVAGLKRGDGLYADHINRDKLDNRSENLRIVTPAESRQNTPAIRGQSRGVSFDRERGRWRASAGLDGRNHFIGRFATEAEAASAARSWRLSHMPCAVD